MIKKTPPPTPPSVPAIDPKQAQSFANQSNVAKVSKSRKKEQDTASKDAIRLLIPELEELDKHIDSLPLVRGKKISRHSWIIEAIYEKKEREEKRFVK